MQKHSNVDVYSACFESVGSIQAHHPELCSIWRSLLAGAKVNWGFLTEIWRRCWKIETTFLKRAEQYQNIWTLFAQALFMFCSVLPGVFWHFVPVMVVLMPHFLARSFHGRQGQWRVILFENS